MHEEELVGRGEGADEPIRFPEAADDIRVSGRWAALNTRIEELAANPDQGNAWQTQLFGRLASEMFSEYLLLRESYLAPRRGDVPLLAWRARNLLELSVWATYCATSRDQARKWYVAALRDPGGVEAEGTESYDNCGKVVLQAADECGLAEFVSVRWRTLSSFAHPTATRILRSTDSVKRRDQFYSDGCLFFLGAFNSIDHALSAL